MLYNIYRIISPQNKTITAYAQFLHSSYYRERLAGTRRFSPCRPQERGGKRGRAPLPATLLRPGDFLINAGLSADVRPALCRFGWALFEKKKEGEGTTGGRERSGARAAKCRGARRLGGRDRGGGASVRLTSSGVFTARAGVFA
ncbi:hypothetical protein GWI33_002878 [Rhynchophorus ferrugineus]|uniref:Uncharacterized protein n=1 Tax=Rhynchophorus ferrugineus TaxID=354439 RepID=A0A834IM16_RHYFE|nr:hypothetical protein GWI33_002878 [Rhynchophorus ferrugineus]